ncbi:MAG TPA: hypothetical protein VMV53_06000 [Acidimicrobiales bacterium]|nr:hypothetical protein [Acidimicrobiales bacterium]
MDPGALTSSKVVRHCHIAVIESATDAAHYPHLNRRLFKDLDDPWLRLSYFDESSLDDLLGTRLHERFAAVYFTAGAMQLPSIREQITQYGPSLNTSIHAGLGVIISAHTLGAAERFDLDFLPEGRQVSFVSTKMRAISGQILFAGVASQELVTRNNQVGMTALALATSQAAEWKESVTLIRDDGAREALAWRTQLGGGFLIATVLPLERLDTCETLESGLIRATRGRGHLIIGPGSRPAWYASPPPGDFVFELEFDHLPQEKMEEIERKFSHVHFCEGVEWRSLALTKADLLQRLENGGSIEFPASGPQGTIFARLAGTPRYLKILNVAQRDLAARIPTLSQSPTFQLLAFALLVKAANEVVRSPQHVPEVLRLESLRALLDATTSKRVSGGSVDELLLPTTNILCALRVLERSRPSEVAQSLERWIRDHAAESDPDQRSQARLAAMISGSSNLLTLIPGAETRPPSIIGQIGYDIDHQVATLEFDELSMVDEAILAYTKVALDLEGAERSLQRLGAFDDGANIEEYCYGRAAAVLLAAGEPLAAHPDVRVIEPAVTTPTLELLREQAEFELNRLRADDAETTLQHVRRTTKTMAGVLGVGYLAVTISAVTLPFWLPSLRQLGVLADWSITISLVALLTGIAGKLLSGPLVEETTPKWMRILVNAVREIRRA